jgi:hypothetical protein
LHVRGKRHGKAQTKPCSSCRAGRLEGLKVHRETAATRASRLSVHMLKIGQKASRHIFGADLFCEQCLMNGWLGGADFAETPKQKQAGCSISTSTSKAEPTKVALQHRQSLTVQYNRSCCCNFLLHRPCSRYANHRASRGSKSVYMLSPDGMCRSPKVNFGGGKKKYSKYLQCLTHQCISDKTN